MRVIGEFLLSDLQTFPLKIYFMKLFIGFNVRKVIYSEGILIH